MARKNGHARRTEPPGAEAVQSNLLACHDPRR